MGRGPWGDPLLVEESAREGRFRDPEDEMPRPLLWNLLLIVVAGTFVMGWLLHFTDLFPMVGGLLGLGGVFAWVAFVSGILRDERKQQLQEAFERRFLSRSSSSILILLVFTGFVFVVALRRGTLELDASLDPVGRRIAIFESNGGDRDAERAVETLTLAPRTMAHVLLPTGLSSTRTFELRADGLPTRRVELSALGKKTIRLPDDFFERPLYVATVDAERLETIREFGDFRAEVRLRGPDGREHARQGIAPYDGRPIWIGARAGVIVPDALLARWRIDLVVAGEPSAVVESWRTPWGGDLVPVPGQVMHVRVIQLSSFEGEVDCVEWAEASREVERVGPFPRELELAWNPKRKPCETPPIP